MNSRLLTLMLVIASPVWASAAITGFSLTRSLAADAQAGGVTYQTASAGGDGLFEQLISDSESFSGRSASTKAFQQTTLTLDSQSLDFSGAAYTRNTSQGDAVRAIGSSEANLYFNIDSSFTYTVSAIFGIVGNGGNDFVENTTRFIVLLTRVLPEGESVVFSLTGDGASPQTGFIGPGNYHLEYTARLDTMAARFEPQTIDRTLSIHDLSFTLGVAPLPEPTVTMLLGGAALLLGSRRRTARIKPPA